MGIGKNRTLGFFALLCCLLPLPQLVFADFDWNPASRAPIRSQMFDCKTILATALDGPVNDSVGITLSSHDLSDFKDSIQRALHEKGRGAIAGGQIFITGIDIRANEAEFVEPYRKILREFGFADHEVQIRPLSVPKTKFANSVKQMATAVIERISWWFPSLKRDYQTPEFKEVMSGLISTAVIEAPNVVYLLHNMPKKDAALTLTAHTVILTAYSVYKKFMVNWLLRPGSGRVELLLKQVSFSFPFIVNYNLFGNFSKILQFYQQNGMAAVARAFPAEIANFGTTQGLTAFLQTLFYSVVITKGIRGWENSQIGDERSRIARVVSNYNATPILILDAMALAMASKTGENLLNLGPLSINSGHLALAGLTVAGSSLIIWPQILNPTITLYKWASRLVGRRASSR